MQILQTSVKNLVKTKINLCTKKQMFQFHMVMLKSPFLTLMWQT